MGKIIASLTLVLLLYPYASHAAIDPYNTIDVEKEVKSFFADAPAMVQIAKCESKFRQYDDMTGELLNGGDGGMIGVFQINSAVHKKAALALGYDIETLSGNLFYAKHLYETEGTSPWNSSSSCWKRNSSSNLTQEQIDAILNLLISFGADQGTISSVKVALLGELVTFKFSKDLSYGQTDEEIRKLQMKLNSDPQTRVAAVGLGSPGKETNFFGDLTKNAVVRFQTKNNLPATGFIDEATRTRLNSA